jgi:hypothetical protein
MVRFVKFRKARSAWTKRFRPRNYDDSLDWDRELIESSAYEDETRE